MKMHATRTIALLAFVVCEVAAGPLPDGVVVKRAPPGQCGGSTMILDHVIDNGN